MSKLYNQWRYKAPAIWVNCSGGLLPEGNSVSGGHDVNGETLYIGRAVHSDNTLPGKVVPSHRCCYVAQNGVEHSYRHYQVLVNPDRSPLIWVQSKNGEIPTGALQGGMENDGQPLYIGRAYYNGSMVIGKVYPPHRILYIPFEGKEISINSSFEVLVSQTINM